MIGRKSRVLASSGYQKKLRRRFKCLENYMDMLLTEDSAGVFFNIRPISIMSKTDFFEIASILESKGVIN